MGARLHVISKQAIAAFFAVTSQVVVVICHHVQCSQRFRHIRPLPRHQDPHFAQSSIQKCLWKSPCSMYLTASRFQNTTNFIHKQCWRALLSRWPVALRTFSSHIYFRTSKFNKNKYAILLSVIVSMFC